MNRRKTPAPFRGQRGRCAWCGTTEIPKGRRSWCSRECVDAYLLRNSSEHIRRAVHERDRGICALCGCDADAEYRAWVARRREVGRLAEWLVRRERWNLDHVGGRFVFRAGTQPSWVETSRFRKHLITKYAPGRWTPARKSGWDADHIVPVVEGGADCGLDNFRTLCHPCHKTVTKDLARRRARKNKVDVTPIV